MSVLVDTGVFYAAFDSDAPRHETATDALRAVLTDASYGQVVTTDYVYDETVTLTAARTDSTQRAIDVGKRLRSSDGDWGDAIRLRFVTNAVFDDAVQLFEEYDDHELSFTDATTVALCDRYGIDAVLSFDDDFDGLVDRLDIEQVAGE
jgi:predicted nucleic acid-binding protein